MKSSQCSFFRHIFLFTLCAFSAASAQAQVDPAKEWKRWKLPAFDLIYDAKHQEVADLYARRLLKIPPLLQTYFPNTPERTVFVIDDRTDLTNGYATPLPYDTIVIYPVLPGPNETISDIGDWAQEISLHEFTHISSFEHRRGGALALYYMFGNVITPNLLLPRWWLEGVAVDMETRTGQYGRLRSPFQDAAIRALAQDSQWLNRDISEINETSIHTWPQGARPYLFGSLMWNEMIRKYGTKVVEELHHRYGGRFPYFIETPIEDFGHGPYSDHFAEMKVHLFAQVQKQKEILSQVKLSSGSRIQFQNIIESFHPSLSPDGLKLLLLGKDDTNKRSVRILSRKTVKDEFNGYGELGEIDSDLNEGMKELNPSPKKLQESCFDTGIQFGLMNSRGNAENDPDDGPPGGAIQRLSWFPSSDKFVFDKIETLNRFQETSELYVYDLKTKKSEPLTVNQRAREASVSLDGRQVVFVKLGAAKTSLALLDLSSKKISEIYRPELQVRLSYPLFIDSENVVFSERRNGQELLKKMNLKTQKIETLAAAYKNARYPVLTEYAGKSGLVFSSTASGVANAYFLDLKTQNVQPLTHSMTAISSSVIDKNKNLLIASELRSTGYELRTFDLNETLPAQLPQVSPLLAADYPVTAAEMPSSTSDELTSLRKDIEDYSIFPYIWPHYWLPSIGIYGNGAYLGAGLASSDPLGKHQYSLSFLYDTKPQELSDQWSYLNNQTEALFALTGFDLKSSVPNTRTSFRHQKYNLKGLWEINSVSTDLYLGMGYSWVGRNYDAPYTAGDTRSHGPSLLMLYSDQTQSGAQTSPVTGQQASAEFTHFVGNHDSENESFNQFEVMAQKFWNPWLPRHHSILTRFSAQAIDRKLGEIRSANLAYTLGSNPFASQLPSTYVIRGYPTAQFLAKNIAISTLEYRLPVAYPYMGSGTLPLFFKKLHVAAVADGATLEGYSYNRDRTIYERVGSWEPFWSAGLEVKADLTIGYHFPVTFMVGMYQAFNLAEGGEKSMIFNLQM